MKKHKETNTTESRIEMQSRLREFYVTSYEMKLDPDEEPPSIIDLTFSIKPGVVFTLDLKKLLVTIDVYLFHKKEKELETKRILCRIITRTIFDIKGYTEKDLERIKEGKFSIDVDAVRGDIMTAAATTRGALSLISGGKFTLAILSSSLFPLTDLRFGPVMAADLNKPSAQVVTEENKSKLGHVKSA